MKKWKCSVCGYVHTGETAPDPCPVCGAPQSAFVLEEEPAAEPSAAAEEAPASEKTDPNPSHGPLDQKLREGKFAGLYILAVEQIRKHHLHPVSVHIPNGVVPLCTLFVFLGIMMHSDALIDAAFFNMIFVFLSMPLVAFSGFADWQRKYMGSWTSVFKIKAGCAVAVFALAFVLVVWRAANPEILTAGSKWIYFLLHLIQLGAAGAAGFFGGRLVFGKDA